MSTQPTIIVAGMGPVGMTAALMLARHGLTVTVLEAGPDLATESRASTFHPSSLEILDGLGVVDDLLEVGLKAPGFQYRGHNRELIAHLDMEVLGEDTRFPYRVQSEQSNLTRIIRGHLEKMPNVTLRFNAPVERVEEGREHAYIYLPGDGFDASYRADWLIAADGSNSAVRRSMGIAFEGVTYPERFLVASTTHEFRDDFEGLAHVSYVYDPEDWGVLLRTPNHWRVLFPIDPSETNEQASDPARIEERLQGVSPRPEPYPVVHSTIYAVHQRLAATFGRGRVMLVGDAAHINNPLGGMGMNSGIHDAEAAVTAVLYALEGGDPVRAVETYARVRRDAAAIDVQQNTQKNYDEMRERDSSARAARMTEMQEISADPARMRAYLRGAALLSSREVSNRRMKRSLTPVRGASPVASGRRLSDALGARALTGAAVGEAAAGTSVTYLAAAPSWHGEIHGAAAQTERPLIVSLGDDWSDAGDVVRAVVAFEQAGIAAVEISDDGTTDPAAVTSAIEAAAATRRDLLVLATTGPFAGDVVASAITRAERYAAAGADLVGLVGITAVEDIAAVHRAVPDVPLVLITAPGAELPALPDLQLAGVGLVLSGALVVG